MLTRLTFEGITEFLRDIEISDAHRGNIAHRVKSNKTILALEIPVDDGEQFRCFYQRKYEKKERRENRQDEGR